MGILGRELERTPPPKPKDAQRICSGGLLLITRQLSHSESGESAPRLCGNSVDGMEIRTNIRIATIATRPRGDSTEAIEPVLRRSASARREDRPRRGWPRRQESPQRRNEKRTNEANEFGDKIFLDSDLGRPRSIAPEQTNPSIATDLIGSLTFSGRVERIRPAAPRIPVTRVRSV